jgi:hypothetical protein
MPARTKDSGVPPTPTHIDSGLLYVPSSAIAVFLGRPLQVIVIGYCPLSPTVVLTHLHDRLEEDDERRLEGAEEDR